MGLGLRVKLSAVAVVETGGGKETGRCRGCVVGNGSRAVDNGRPVGVGTTCSCGCLGFSIAMASASETSVGAGFSDKKEGKMLLEVAGSVSSDVSKAHSATHSGNKDVMMLLVNDSLLIACLGLPMRGVENLLSNSNGCYTLSRLETSANGIYAV